MTGRRSLLLLIPVYNEEESLGAVLEEIRQAHLEGDVLLIDDGSTDRTAEVARQAGFEVLPLGRNRGYGAALVCGYREALDRGYEVLVQLDGDGQHDPAQVGDLLSRLQPGDVDMVFGSRLLSGGGHKTSLFRRVGIAFFVWLGRWLARSPITDPTSGFAAMNRRGMTFLAEHTPSDYPDLNVRLALERGGVRVAEVPVVMRQRLAGVSQTQGLMPLVYFPKMLFYIWRVYRSRPQPR